MTLLLQTKPYNAYQLALSKILLVLVALCLSGCSGTPTPLTYYLLHNTSTQDDVSADGDNALASASSANTITIEKMVLPAYLKQRGLVYQTNPTNLHISTSHLWAEPVEEGVIKALKQALSHYNVILLRTDLHDTENTLRLSLYVNDFVSTYNGDIIINGDYTLTKPPSLPKLYSFSFTTPLEKDGFSSSVEAMRVALRQLATRIASDLETEAY